MKEIWRVQVVDDNDKELFKIDKYDHEIKDIKYSWNEGKLTIIITKYEKVMCDECWDEYPIIDMEKWGDDWVCENCMRKTKYF